MAEYVTPTLNGYQGDIARHAALGTRLVATRGAWGCGKTMSLVVVALIMSEIHPGDAGLLVVDTQPRYIRVHRPELEKWLMPLGWIEHRAEMRWVAPNGSSLTTIPYFRTSTRAATTNPLEGFNGSYGLVDEAQALPEEMLHKLIGRLRAGKKAQVFLWGLPVWDAWWERFAEDHGGVVLLPKTIANKANLPDDYFENPPCCPRLSASPWSRTSHSPRPARCFRNCCRSRIQRAISRPMSGPTMRTGRHGSPPTGDCASHR